MINLRSELIALFSALGVAFGTYRAEFIDHSRPARTPNPPVTYPPALQRTLEAYFHGHVNEFLTLARTPENWLDPNGADEPDNEIPGVLVTGDGCTLDQPLTIRPARDTHKLKHWKKGNPGSSPSDLDKPAAKGFLVARISNPNGCGTTPINFPPGYTYWVVRKTSTGTYESQLINELHPGLNTHPGSFERCNNPDHDQPNDFADVFLKSDECSDTLISQVERSALHRARYHARIGQQLRLHLLQLLPPGARGLRGQLPFDPKSDAISLWFACDAGCCYAEF